MEIATSDSWQNRPMPPEVAVLSYTAEFSLEEFERLSRGLIPQAMEDKWFIFLEGNTLRLHRSWTGSCIYLVEFARNGEEYSVCCATANRLLDEYQQTDDTYDTQLLHFLISNLLLGHNTPFPVPSNLPKGAPEGLYQHSVAGSGYPEIPVVIEDPEHFEGTESIRSPKKEINPQFWVFWK